MRETVRERMMKLKGRMSGPWKLPSITYSYSITYDILMCKRLAYLLTSFKLCITATMREDKPEFQSLHKTSE